MKKNCYQCDNYDWTKQKIKNRTTIVRSHRSQKASLLDHIRSLLF
jgi:hypothetical protein